MAAGQDLIRLAVFGRPVEHSRSPQIHTLFGRQAGLAIDYRAIDCGPEDFAQRVGELAAAGGRGGNVTVPHKQRAFELTRRHSERARLAGSVNTLVFESAGDWFGDNTDGAGLVRDLLANLGLQLSGARIAVLGAGGATAGILPELLLQKPARLVIVNRDVVRGRRLAARCGGENPPECADYFTAHGPFDLVINATAVGHQGGVPDLDPGWFGDRSACYDLNYGPAHQPLADWCANHDIDCHGGLGMLVEQAAESFRLWTGFQPQTGPVIAALAQNR